MTVTTSMDSGADFGTPPTMRRARSSTEASSTTGIPNSLARRSFRESGAPRLATSNPVLPLAAFITSRPASASRRANACRGSAVSPVMTTFVPWIKPTAGSYRPGSRHGHGTRVTLSGYARDIAEHATIGNASSNSPARSTLRRKTSARVRTSSRASWAVCCLIPQYAARVPSFTLGTSSCKRRASVTVQRRCAIGRLAPSRPASSTRKPWSKVALCATRVRPASIWLR